MSGKPKILIDIKVEPIKNKDDNDKSLNNARLVKLKEKIEKGDLKLIVAESIIGQLARLAVLGLKTNWILLLLVAVSVGIGAGGIGYSVGISHIPTYLNVTASNPIHTLAPNSTITIG